MKIGLRYIILLLGLAAFAACTPSVKVPEPVEGPSPELSAIDSLMWRQPDSALAMLMDYLNDGGRDGVHTVSTDQTFENHYAQLLLAELLYKNYQPQTNRDELLRAVDYFDSLCDCTDVARNVSTDPTIAFLDARARYINGVGFYEQGDVVDACAEYLNALEVMEDSFEEQELIGEKARFMANIYNRLGDLFSEQFMMESAISCYEKALVYCTIEPTSSVGVSNILYRIGKQYDKKNEIDKARLYYGQALENMSVTDKMVYRDIVSSKALCDYKAGVAAELSLDKIRPVLLQAETNAERLNRFLTIGGIYFSESIYDSALYYLKPVFDDPGTGLQDQAANYLHVIYDKLGESELSDSIMRFLTSRKKLDGENKALVSKLEDLLKIYLGQKIERISERDRKKAIKKTIAVIVPLAIIAAAAIYFMVNRRSRKRLKDLQGVNEYLQSENQKLVKLSERLPGKAEAREYDALLRESVCMDLLQRFGQTEILTTNKPDKYAALAITTKERQALASAVMKHCPGFAPILKGHYPAIKAADLDVCRLFLIGLSEQQIAVLLQKDYSTIWKRAKRLKKEMGMVEPKMHLRRLLFEL